MARTQNTLIGRASGSVGGVTFSTWKGINVIKQKPETVANPQTNGQVQQRSGMAQMVAIFRAIATIVNIGFKKLAINMSAYNAFISANLVSAFDYTVAGIATFVPANLFTAKGTMESTVMTSVVADVSVGFVTFTWPTSATGLGQSVDDEANIAVLNITLNEWIFEEFTGARSDGTGGTTLPATWVAGNNLAGYCFFRNPLTDEVSDSSVNLITVIA